MTRQEHKLAQALSGYARYYETLTAESVVELHDLVAPDLHFRDPFNDTRSAAAYERVLAKMFVDVVEPRFETLHTVLDGAVGYMKWRFAFQAKRGGTREVIGMSELHFDEGGRITKHIDFWDPASQLYEHVPVLGFVLRKVRERIAA